MSSRNRVGSTRAKHAARRRSRAPLWTSVGAALATLLAVSAVAYADARTDYLVRALRTSQMFRVRAQAAISLGAVQTEPQVVEALTAALRDDHPTVRAAAASSLERHGDPSALPALRAATRDRERAVAQAAERAIRTLERVARSQPQRHPRGRSRGSSGSSSSSGPARYYVAVGQPGTRVSGVSRDVLDRARSVIASTAGGMSGVEIAPEGERPRAAQRVLSQRSLVGYYLDSSIVELESRPGGGLRARVSVVLQSYPDRNIRSMLNGSATVMGATGAQAQQQAIEGAIRGALRNLPQAMAAAAASAQASQPSRRGRRRRR
ncbi:MAG: HEAT repeat domain-containing protein [Myxococcota bacterium]|nr:HEAT repeat domain-containing protein [Myxococcota bacterium]